jgi:apolipoprotein N-acyltransferase
LFLLGLTCGSVYFLGTLYWTSAVMEVFGGLGWPLATAISLLLVAYLALYPALFAVIVGTTATRLGLVAIGLSPAIWVATEFARGYLFSGFPWVLLGYSQVAVLPVAQSASVVGVFGVSGLVAFVNACLAYAVVARTVWRRAGSAAIAAGCLGIVSVWGQARLH